MAITYDKLPIHRYTHVTSVRYNTTEVNVAYYNNQVVYVNAVPVDFATASDSELAVLFTAAKSGVIQLENYLIPNPRTITLNNGSTAVIQILGFQNYDVNSVMQIGIVSYKCIGWQSTVVNRESGVGYLKETLNYNYSDCACVTNSQALYNNLPDFWKNNLISFDMNVCDYTVEYVVHYHGSDTASDPTISESSYTVSAENSHIESTKLFPRPKFSWNSPKPNTSYWVFDSLITGTHTRYYKSYLDNQGYRHTSESESLNYSDWFKWYLTDGSKLSTAVESYLQSFGMI